MLKELRLELERLTAKRRDLVEADHEARSGELLSFYVQIMTKLTDSERCSVFIHDPAKGMAWLKAGTGVGEKQIQVPAKDSVVGRVIASGEPVIISGLDTKPGAHKAADQATGFVTRNILCVPIKSRTRNEVTGAFELINKKNGQEFTDEDMSLARVIAGHLQQEVDGIFLDQEIFGLTGRLYAAARTLINVSVACGALVVLSGIVALAAWGILPRVFG